MLSCLGLEVNSASLNSPSTSDHFTSGHKVELEVRSKVGEDETFILHSGVRVAYLGLWSGLGVSPDSFIEGTPCIVTFVHRACPMHAGSPTTL